MEEDDTVRYVISKACRSIPFKSDSEQRPENPYGRSKQFAEKLIVEFSNKNERAYTFIQEPLIHGRNVKGNLKVLETCIRYRIPLPFFGLNKNKRSMVSLGYLSSLILKSLDNPLSKGQSFMVKGSSDFSTVDIIKVVSNHVSAKTILFFMPSYSMTIIFKILNCEHLTQRLFNSFLVDHEFTRKNSIEILTTNIN